MNLEMTYIVGGKKITEVVTFVCYEKNDMVSVVSEGELILVPGSSLKHIK